MVRKTRELLVGDRAEKATSQALDCIHLLFDGLERRIGSNQKTVIVKSEIGASQIVHGLLVLLDESGASKQSQARLGCRFDGMMVAKLLW